MIDDCMTLEAQRRDHEAARSQYHSQHNGYANVPVAPPQPKPRPTLTPSKPANTLSCVAEQNALNEQTVAALAAQLRWPEPMVRERAKAIAHDSRTLRYEDVLDAARRGAIRL